MAESPTSPLRIARCHDREALLKVIEPHEPGSTRMVELVSRTGLSRRTRAWIVLNGTEPAGALVIDRAGVDNWRALPLLFDPAAAPLLAPVIARSSASSIGGLEHHVAPLLPHLAGSRDVVSMKCHYMADYPPLGPLDPRARNANARDLPQLVDLYSGYELDTFANRRELYQALQAMLSVGVITVVEEDGRIVAAARGEAVTSKVIYWSGLTVLPECRGRGLAEALLATGIKLTADRGLAIFAVVAPSNHFRPSSDAQERYFDPTAYEPWLAVRHEPHRHFRGQARMLRLLKRVRRRLDRREVKVDPIGSE